MELEEVRTEIDRVNEELLRLFEKRMALCGQVAAYKQAHHMEVFVPAREVSILEKVQKQSIPAFAEYNLRFFNTLLSLSREYQQKLLENGNDKPGLPAEIHTPRLHLIQLDESAAPAVYSITSDPEIMRETTLQVHQNEEDAVSLIRAMTKQGCFAYAVFDPEQKFIGICGTSPNRLDPFCLNLHLLIAKSAFQNGCGSELLELMVDAAQKFTPAKLLCIQVPEQSTSIRHILKNRGFETDSVRNTDAAFQTYRISL